MFIIPNLFTYEFRCLYRNIANSNAERKNIKT